MAKAKAKSQSKAKSAKSAVKTKKSVKPVIKPVKKAASVKRPAPKKAKKVVSKSAKAKTAQVKVTKATGPGTRSAGKTAKPAAKKTSAPASRTKSLSKTTAKDWSQILSPLDDRVLVKVDAEKERRTAGGLYLPETSEVKGNFQGLVVSVGPGHRDKKGRFRPLELKVGDRVLFAEWTGTEVQLENESFKILRETEVLGLLD